MCVYGIWTNRKCVIWVSDVRCCCGSTFVCVFDCVRAYCTELISALFYFTVWCDSRQRELDSLFVWSHRPVILRRHAPLLHHHFPWRYTHTHKPNPIWTLNRVSTIKFYNSHYGLFFPSASSNNIIHIHLGYSPSVCCDFVDLRSLRAQHVCV